jgi:DNA polymerase-3 subunit delta
MIYKSFILEKDLQIVNNHSIFLFYGENHGLKKDFKENLKALNKDCEVINLFQTEIIKNENILINEILNKSLFIEKKIIFVNEINDKMLEVLEGIIDNIQNDNIFLFADTLDKRSKIRSFFEKSKILGISACYQDNPMTLRKIISDKLSTYKGLNPEIINLIIKSTGLDRNKVNNEIEKIISCFQDKIILPDLLDELLNIKVNDDFNLLKDEALNGNKINTNRLLADTVFEAENNIYYLNLINQRINKLNEIQNMEQKGTNIEALISNLKPPVFWKDKPKLIEQSRKWNKHKIRIALKKTYDTEVEIKSNSLIRKDLLIKNLIIDLCATASSA